MPSSSRGPQQLRDAIVQTRVHHERDQFIAAIHEDDVCRLASSYHNGDPCSFFKPAARGSYNICYFVHFPSHSSNEHTDKWVVRVPLAPCLAFGSSSKLESEIATMQLVAERTTIPLPKIHAYSLRDGPEPLSSFLILEYVEGVKLSCARLRTLSNDQRSQFYTSLADIHIQLRRLEFSSIGCLTRSAKGFDVRKKVVTIDVNMQELEGLQPSKIQSSFYNDEDVLTSSNDYVAMLLQIADNAFAKSRSSVLKEALGEEALYYLHIFREYAKDWIDCYLDRGPFVLVHGDFEPCNLLVDEDLHITSVLDWEWSRVVPVQFNKPPLWFKIPDTTILAWEFVYNDYLKSFDQFLEVVRSREREIYGNELLSDEWAKAKADSGFLVANALENWTDIDWFADRYVNWKCYRGRLDLDKRVKIFMDCLDRKALIARKFAEGNAYMAELGRLDTATNEIASAYRGYPASVYAIMKSFTPYRPWKATFPFSLSVLQLALGGAIIGTSYLLSKRIIRPSFRSCS